MANILILGGSEYQKHSIISIKEDGHTIHLLDRDKDPYCKQFSDYFESIDYSKKQDVLEYSMRNNIDCIVPLNDFGVHAAFYVSQKLGLLNSNYVTAKCSTDKGLMREIWQIEEVPQPNFKVFQKSDYIDLNQFNLPVVVKPTDSSGGRGITIAREIEELKFSIDLAKKFTVNNNRIIIEEFIEGIEVTVEGLAHNGNIELLTISDKVKPDSKFRVATSLNYPSYFNIEITEKIFNITAKAAESLGIANGAIHAELIVSPDETEIKIVELGARGGGGHVFGKIINAVTGIDAPKEYVKILLGEEPSLFKRKSKGCVYRFFNPSEEGILKEIKYDKTIFQNDFVLDYGFTIKVGDRYEGLSNSLKRIGFLVVSGKDRADAIKNADFIEENILFNFEK